MSRPVKGSLVLGIVRYMLSGLVSILKVFSGHVLFSVIAVGI